MIAGPASPTCEILRDASDEGHVSGPDDDALIAHCRRLIGGYKVPRRFRFIEAMPTSEMGKILKSDLRRRVTPRGNAADP